VIETERGQRDRPTVTAAQQYVFFDELFELHGF
jgi:hypothetical protein